MPNDYLALIKKGVLKPFVKMETLTKTYYTQGVIRFNDKFLKLGEQYSIYIRGQYRFMYFVRCYTDPLTFEFAYGGPYQPISYAIKLEDLFIEGINVNSWSKPVAKERVYVEPVNSYYDAAEDVDWP